MALGLSWIFGLNNKVLVPSQHWSPYESASPSSADGLPFNNNKKAIAVHGVSQKARWMFVARCSASLHCLQKGKQ